MTRTRTTLKIKKAGGGIRNKDRFNAYVKDYGEPPAYFLVKSPVFVPVALVCACVLVCLKCDWHGLWFVVGGWLVGNLHISVSASRVFVRVITFVLFTVPYIGKY
jgi:hypothetical protein